MVFDGVISFKSRFVFFLSFISLKCLKLNKNKKKAISIKKQSKTNKKKHKKRVQKKLLMHLEWLNNCIVGLHPIHSIWYIQQFNLVKFYLLLFYLLLFYVHMLVHHYKQPLLIFFLCVLIFFSFLAFVLLLFETVRERIQLFHVL